MNTMPMVHAIQWAAMLAIDRGNNVVYNPWQRERIEELERKEILDA